MMAFEVKKIDLYQSSKVLFALVLLYAFKSDCTEFSQIKKDQVRWHYCYLYTSIQIFTFKFKKTIGVLSVPCWDSWMDHEE